MQPVVELGQVQATDGLVADLAKVGIRTKTRMVGGVGHFTSLVRDSNVRVVIGYASLRRRRDPLLLHDVQPALQPLLQNGA